MANRRGSLENRTIVLSLLVSIIVYVLVLVLPSNLLGAIHEHNIIA